jgi:tetratricopeptide (TPR) repeat protein
MPRLCNLLWVLVCACGPSLEDQIERLNGSGDELEEAKQELLVATDQSVAPLLEALEDQRPTGARREIVDVLSSLMARLDDKRVSTALQRHLHDDPDPEVRARIAHRMGIYKRLDAIPALLAALDDAEGDVRHEAFVALDMLEGKLDEPQKETLKEKVPDLVADPDDDVRLEAMIVAEKFVDEWVREARQLEVKARIAEADSVYHAALAYSPGSKRALYRLGKFYMANGEREKGLELMRRHGFLLDVPLLQIAPPVIDGHLDEAFWQRAARVDSFSQVSHYHLAVLPAHVQTGFRVAYTEEWFYFGAYLNEAHPESLVVESSEHDNLNFYQDLIEMHHQPDLDQRNYSYIGINADAVVSDAWDTEHWGNRDFNWNPETEVAAFVGSDFWSVEYRARLGDIHFPHPQPGDLWGFDSIRGFRGIEYSIWPLSRGGIDEHGLLLFE